MRWFVRTIVSVVVLSVVLFISIWFSLPSTKDYEFIARSATQYAPIFLDRNSVPLQADFRFQSQSLYTPLDSVPEYFINYLVYFEDGTFWSNIGINPFRIGYAFILRVLGDRYAGGASTITQQVVRLSTGYGRRTYWRKMVEIVGAVKLWLTMSKRQILELYLNLAPFGTRRYVGIAAAARYYFSKTPTALTPAESIMLISFLSHPPGDVMKNLKQVCFWYRERVQRLVASGRLSIPSAMVNAYFADPTFMITPLNDTRNGIYIDRAYEEVAKILVKNPAIGLDYSGLTIETTLDKATDDTVQDILNDALSRYPGAKASFLLLDQNEQPVVYTNSYPTKRGDFDLIYSTGSLPASRMKFPVYAICIEKLRSTENMSGRKIFEMILPTSYRVSSRFTVRDRHLGEYVPLRLAFAVSSNAAAYFVVNRILSPTFVVDNLQRFDIQLMPFKSLALGSQPISELRLCAAYDAIILRNGFYRKPSFVRRIFSKNGGVIFRNDETWAGRQILSSTTCSIAKELLREASDVGTSRALSKLTFLDTHDYGAKTGTSRQDKQLGVTGFIDRYCFSLHLESDVPFPGEAERVAVPILVRILRVLVERGY